MKESRGESLSAEDLKACRSATQNSDSRTDGLQDPSDATPSSLVMQDSCELSKAEQARKGEEICLKANATLVCLKRIKLLTWLRLSPSPTPYNPRTLNPFDFVSFMATRGGSSFNSLLQSDCKPRDLIWLCRSCGSVKSNLQLYNLIHMQAPNPKLETTHPTPQRTNRFSDPGSLRDEKGTLTKKTNPKLQSPDSAPKVDAGASKPKFDKQYVKRPGRMEVSGFWGGV